MRVIGKDDSIAKRVTCRHCATILEYLPIDIVSVTHFDYAGGRDQVKYIVCPPCGNKVTV